MPNFLKVAPASEECFLQTLKCKNYTIGMERNITL